MELGREFIRTSAAIIMDKNMGIMKDTRIQSQSLGFDKDLNNHAFRNPEMGALGIFFNAIKCRNPILVKPNCLKIEFYNRHSKFNTTGFRRNQFSYPTNIDFGKIEF